MVKRGIAIGMNAQGLAIDKDLGIPINPFKINTNVLALPGGRGVEGFAVPTYARGGIAPVVARWMVGINGAFNAPVMGQI